MLVCAVRSVSMASPVAAEAAAKPVTEDEDAKIKGEGEAVDFDLEDDLEEIEEVDFEQLGALAALAALVSLRCGWLTCAQEENS